MRPKPVSEKERQQIIEALKSGEMSQGAIARKFGRHVSTINRIAKVEGIKSNVAEPKKATEARITYARAERIRLIDKALDKADAMLEILAKPGELQQLAMALAVLLDKRRQEDDDGGKRRGAISELMQRLRGDEADADVGATDG